MKKEDGFYFNPKRWLGDANIIAMDWDCKGMHLHLMAIAWQQTPKGHIIDDENLILKLLGNPDKEDWEKRIKPQIFKAWKKKTITEDGVKQNYWVQPGIVKTQEETVQKKTRTTKKAALAVIEDCELSYPGFSLANILKEKITSTILYEKGNEQDKITIWNVGLSLIKKQNESEGQTRAFLAKLIKQYGEKTVASAIAELSVKGVNPVEVHSYLLGILKKKLTEQENGTKSSGTGRGRVSL